MTAKRPRPVAIRCSVTARDAATESTATCGQPGGGSRSPRSTIGWLGDRSASAAPVRLSGENTMPSIMWVCAPADQPFVLPGATGALQQAEVAPLDAHLREQRREFGEVRRLKFRYDESEEAAPPVLELARGEVRPVTERDDCLLDPGSGRRPHVRILVDHVRDRPHRN